MIMKYFLGYQYSFPFLSSDVKLDTRNRHVEPLYKHVVHMDYPNLFFIGIPGGVIPFPAMHVEAQLVLAILSGATILPSSDQMHSEYEAEKAKLLAAGVQVIWVTTTNNFSLFFL